MNKYQVDRQKWSKMSIFEQMGNIYAEVGRTFKAKAAHDAENATQAAIRALDLFDATAEDLSAVQSPQLRELLRAREVFCREFLDAEDTSLDGYFMPFAVAARLRSGV